MWGKDSVFIITHSWPLIECPPSQRITSAVPRPFHMLSPGQIVCVCVCVWVCGCVWWGGGDEDWDMIQCPRLLNYEVRGRGGV